MSDSERNELEAIAEVPVDVAADAVIAEADADFADLAVDAAAELEQDLELEEAIVEAAEIAAAVADEIDDDRGRLETRPDDLSPPAGVRTGV